MYRKKHFFSKIFVLNPYTRDIKNISFRKYVNTENVIELKEYLCLR